MARRIKRTAQKVHRHINHHAIYWALFFGYAFIVALQLLYPIDRVVPFAKLGADVVGFQRYDDIVVKVNDYFFDTHVRVQVDDSRYVMSTVREIGGQVDSDAVARKLTTYPLWLRMIPMSFVALQPHVVSVPVQFEQARLLSASQRFSAVLSTSPRDAGLAIKDGRLELTPSQAGSVVEASDVEKALFSSNYGLVYSVVTVNHQPIQADRTEEFFEAVAERASRFIAMPVVISIKQDNIRPTAEEKASWLSITEEDGQASLKINQVALDDYLSPLQARYSQPAGETHVRRVDGREVERTVGESGQAINLALLKDQVQTMLDSGQYQAITAEFVPVEPSIVINKRYSNSREGLQAYLDDQSAYRNVWVAIKQLDGNGWEAGVGQNQTVVSASTYKLFVALVLFDRMERGQINWDTPILDTTTRGCFERMIVASTNACAEEWIRQFGRREINDYLWSRGFSRGTDFNNPIANHTTASDLTRFFVGLHEGWLTSGWARDYLLNALKRHHYHRGIPAGSAGSVHNKVGYLWDYSNDSAIVYHPKGTYAIAILTKGLSFYAIAEITREVEAIMYP